MFIKQNYIQYVEEYEQLDTDGDNADEYEEDYVYVDYGIEAYNIVSENKSIKHFTKK